MAADKSHLYINAGLPVNEYVSSGLLQDDSKPMGFANTASTNVFTGPHVGEMPMQFANVASSVPQINDAGTTSNGMTVPTNRYPTDAQMGALYQQQRELAGVRTFGVPHDDWVEANANKPSGNVSATIAGGGNRSGVAQAAPIPNVLTSQNLFQRNPSGSVYAPDLSAYNDSSLFNYTGPGGVDEYTYGQDLPYQGAGYDIWGSPTNVPNPYYEGQFAPEPVITEPQGPADGAIGLPPVDMPAGVSPTNNNPNVGTNTTNINTGQDLTYAETLAEMGINPADAPSTTFPSPGDTTAPIVNPGLTLSERQREQIGAENWDAMVAQANAWDNQMREGQLSNIGEEVDSGFKGEEELNKDVQKTTFDYYGDEDADFDAAGYDNFIMGDDGPFEYGEDSLARDVAAGMLKNQQELQAKGQALQDMYDAQERIQTKDRVIDQQFDRNQAEYTPSIRDVTDARPLNLANAAATANTTGYENTYGTPLDFRSAAENANMSNAVNTQHPAYQAMLDRQINEAENAFQMQGTGGLPNKGSYAGSSAGLDGDVLNTQHPAYAAHQNRLENAFQMQGIEGLPNKGSYAGSSADLSSAVNLDKQDFYSADDRFRQIPQSIADVDYDARPMNLANTAENANMSNAVNMQHPAYAAHQNRLENLFQNQETGFPIETRGSFAGSSADLDGAVNADKRTSLFDEQQNYQVPAEEISPGEVGLLNGIVEGLQNYGPNSDRTLLEDQAWDKYYDYKNAGAEALNKGEIDAQAFNELKGKAGGATVIDHFVDKGDHPVINSLFTNAANVLYQGVQTIATDQTIAEGIKDIWQQGSGANDSTPLGSVVEEIARAKEATQQRKEVQENIFTPGPLKYAATARDYTPTIVKEDKPTRIPVVQNKVSNTSTRKKVGPSGKNARSIGYSFPSGPVGRRYGL